MADPERRKLIKMPVKNTKITPALIAKLLELAKAGEPYMATPGEVPKPQFYGLDFVFNQWENPAFADFLKGTSCEELVKTKTLFIYGISTKTDMSDFEGATFTFK
ncbi:MAG: hypothetical protein WA151_08105 [Desulfatirhabdiaceae bacterium]